MSKPLRLWNGRPYGVLSQKEWHLHVNIAAYSIADACRVCTESGLHDPGYREIKEYWSECWGNNMEGIIPQRGIWTVKHGEKPTLRKPK